MQENTTESQERPVVTVGGMAIDLTPRPARPHQQPSGLRVSLDPISATPRPQSSRAWPGIKRRGQLLLLMAVLMGVGIVVGIVLDRQLRQH